MFRGRYIRQFLLWVDKPLVHHQIVDLEDIVDLLMYGLKTVGIRNNWCYGRTGAVIQPATRLLGSWFTGCFIW